MILTGKKIIIEQEQGHITIEPFDPSFVNPNSYNYRIGNTIKKFVEIDASGKPQFIQETIPEEGYKLIPHQMYLASTFETIGSSKYMTSLIGRSSMGRLGLFLQLSANVGHTGTSHKWTLELVATKPLIIYPHMVIGQVAFWHNDGAVKEYSGAYGTYNLPQESLL